MSTQRHPLMVGPRLPPLTVWTWRLVLVLLVINWLFDIAFLAVVAPTLFGDPSASNSILKKVQPSSLRAFVKSRAGLWLSDTLLSIAVILALAMNRNASMYAAIAYWRIVLTSAALATDLAAINGKLPDVVLDPKIVSAVHLIAYDASLGVIVFLMLLIAPPKTPLANPSYAASARTLRSYPNLPATGVSDSYASPATARKSN
ncbi:hypothetical protein BCR44DRAFT_1482966, partial [Catenaria anguillulae PL171]